MSKSVLETLREYSQDTAKAQSLKTHDLELDLCDRMVELREAANLTQKQLAEKLNFSQGYVAKLENGAYDRCGIGTLRTFALALGFDIDLAQLFQPVQPYPEQCFKRKGMQVHFSGHVTGNEPVKQLIEMSEPRQFNIRNRPLHLRLVA